MMRLIRGGGTVIAAQLIYDYFKEKRSATRPELMKVLEMEEGCLDSAMHKMETLQMIVRTDRTKREIGRRACCVWEIGAAPFNAELWKHGANHNPKPRGQERDTFYHSSPNLEALGQLMHTMVKQDGNAQCEEDVHPGRGDDDGGLGPGQCGPEDSSAGEPVRGDESPFCVRTEALSRCRKGVLS